MNPELKAKWIADLRANSKLQGWKYMRTLNGKFCCFGRLCEIYGVPFDDSNHGYVIQTTERRKGYFNHTFPPAMLVDLGISQEQQCQLIDMNDIQCKTFAEIADWIEKNL